jgi:hypothetical protein
MYYSNPASSSQAREPRSTMITCLPWRRPRPCGKTFWHAIETRRSSRRALFPALLTARNPPPPPPIDHHTFRMLTRTSGRRLRMLSTTMTRSPGGARFRATPWIGTRLDLVLNQCMQSGRRRVRGRSDGRQRKSSRLLQAVHGNRARDSEEQKGRERQRDTERQRQRQRQMQRRGYSQTQTQRQRQRQRQEETLRRSWKRAGQSRTRRLPIALEAAIDAPAASCAASTAALPLRASGGRCSRTRGRDGRT